MANSWQEKPLIDNSIQEIRLIFENVESVTVLSGAIEYASFISLEEDVYTYGEEGPLAPKKFELLFNQHLFDTDHLILENLHRAGNHPSYLLLQDFKQHLYLYRDITSIEIITQSNQTYWVAAPWSGESMMTNEGMRLADMPDGSYFLKIDTEDAAAEVPLDESMKFRALSESGEVVYGTPYTRKEETEDMVTKMMVSSEEEVVIVPESLKQFTGLYDKLGEEVYDGDHLMTESDFVCEVIVRGDDIYVVEMSENGSAPAAISQQTLLKEGYRLKAPITS